MKFLVAFTAPAIPVSAISLSAVAQDRYDIRDPIIINQASELVP